MENYTPLTAQELTELAAKAKQGDTNAKEKLLQGNFPLIKSVVKKYSRSSCDYDDLYQIGCLGFLKAINNFDPSFSVKFTTYAVPMIAGEIKRFLRDDGEIKVSRAIKTLGFKIRKFIEEYKNKNQEEPSVDVLAAEFDAEKEDIVYALDASRPMVSLQAKIDDGEDNSALVIDKISEYDQTDKLIDNLLLKTEIMALEPKERKIILLRYFRGKTQSEVAEMLDVSQVQISRIENKILEKLKRRLS